jgi:hypothetical protein
MVFNRTTLFTRFYFLGWDLALVGTLDRDLIRVEPEVPPTTLFSQNQAGWNVRARQICSAIT